MLYPRILTPFFYLQRNHSASKTRVYDHDEYFVVHVDAPGFHKDEITISFEDNTLSVTGHKKIDLPEGYSGHKPQARSLNQQLRFKDTITPDDITAKLTNGVLALHLRKSENKKTTIKVN